MLFYRITMFDWPLIPVRNCFPPNWRREADAKITDTQCGYGRDSFDRARR